MANRACRFHMRRFSVVSRPANRHQTHLRTPESAPDCLSSWTKIIPIQLIVKEKAYTGLDRYVFVCSDLGHECHHAF